MVAERLSSLFYRCLAGKRLYRCCIWWLKRHSEAITLLLELILKVLCASEVLKVRNANQRVERLQRQWFNDLLSRFTVVKRLSRQVGVSQLGFKFEEQ